MKIVKEYLNEIKRGATSSGLGVLNVGKISVIREWLRKKREKNQVGVTYDVDIEGYIRTFTITITARDLKDMPIPAKKDSFEYIKVLNCIECKFDENDNLVPKDKKDYVKGITYDMERDQISSYTFVPHYLYYVALKFIASFGENGVKDQEVINLARRMTFPNSDVDNVSYWEKIFRQDYHTPIVDGTKRIAPRTYAINHYGLDFIEDHRHKFEK